MTSSIPNLLKTVRGRAAAIGIAVAALLAIGFAVSALFGGEQEDKIRKTFVTESGRTTEAGIRYAAHHRDMEALRNASPQLKRNIFQTLARIAKEGRAHESDLDHAHDYLRLSWQALLAGDDKVALDAADRAVSFAGNAGNEYSLGETYDAQLHRAHALMFLGKRDDAFTIYLRYKDRIGANGEPEDQLIWNEAVAADFLSFREAGLSNPLMPDVEQALGIR